MLEISSTPLVIVAILGVIGIILPIISIVILLGAIILVSGEFSNDTGGGSEAACRRTSSRP